MNLRNRSRPKTEGSVKNERNDRGGDLLLGTFWSWSHLNRLPEKIQRKVSKNDDEEKDANSKSQPSSTPTEPATILILLMAATPMDDDDDAVASGDRRNPRTSTLLVFVSSVDRVASIQEPSPRNNNTLPQMQVVVTMDGPQQQ